VVVSTEFTLRRADLTFQDVRVVGLARDGVGSVQIQFRDGTETQAAVVDNVFQLVGLEDRPVAVRWEDRSGTHSEPVDGLTRDELEPLRPTSP
jgi:hypothetical protein